MNTKRTLVPSPQMTLTRARRLSVHSLILACALLTGCYNEIVIPIHSDHIEERFLITKPNHYNFSLAFHCNGYKDQNMRDECHDEIGRSTVNRNNIESQAKIKITRAGHTVLEKIYISKKGGYLLTISSYGLSYFSKFRYLGVVPLEKGEYTITYENLRHDSPLKRHQRFLVIHHSGHKP